MFTRNIYMDFINELKTYFRLIEVNMRKNDFVELELVWVFGDFRMDDLKKKPTKSYVHDV